jgi:hypothetical protein
METSVYVFYALFSFICSLLFLLTFGAGLYSIYVTRMKSNLEEDSQEPKGRFAFLYNKRNGIILLVVGLIFGIVGYRTQPTKMVPEAAKEASHEVKTGEVKKAFEKVHPEKKAFTEAVRGEEAAENSSVEQENEAKP